MLESEGFAATLPADEASARPAVNAASTAATGSRPLQVHFTGSGREYFRIWLLHLLLIVVTLGLYLPFAKARRIRYLYANTWIDGDALAFHGDPKMMFRGFLVLVALFGVYAIGGRFSPLANYVAFLGLCVLWPALWRAGQQFRLANSSWRGLRMAFRGDLAGAYSAFGAAIWPLVLMIGVQQFARSIMEGRIAISAQSASLVSTSMLVVGGLGTLLYIVFLPLVLAKVKHYQHNNYQLASQRAQMQVKTRRFYGLAFKTACWVLVPMLALIGTLLIPDLRQWLTEHKVVGIVAMGGAIGVYLLSFVLIGPFFNARLQNLVWNHTASEQLRFSSHLRFRNLAWLTAKNWTLTLLTLGLYRPFAAIDTWKLRLEAVSIEVTGDMNGWDGSDSAAYADASGEAAGDFFGIDLGL
ncbi:YjgN family protein [Roseateles sp.]|uniref:YjgN family protein n=1 Tax=Roseateles sp. TaxID=1971397 RepID=UPI0039E7A8BB